MLREHVRTRGWLALILAAFAALSLAYSLVTRLKYGPDEPAHFIYIRSLATRLSPPPIAHKITPSESLTASHEGHQPPLYYALMAIPYALLGRLGASNEAIWRVLRLLGIPIGMAWIYCVWLLCRQFFENERRALAATAFVALIPTASFTAGVITNDTLACLLFTWGMLPILAYFRTGAVSARSSTLLGIIVGLAMLTKMHGLILAAIYLVASLAVLRRRAYADSRAALVSAAIVLGVAAAVSGWWFVRSLAVNGSLFPRSLYDPAFELGLGEALIIPWEAAKLVWHSTVTLYGYFWVPFWLVWPFINTWNYYFLPLAALSVFVVVGLVRRLRRNGSLDRKGLALVAFSAALTYLLWLRYVLVVDFLANLQGRLMLPTAYAAGILAVLGFEGWLKGPRARRIGLVVGIALMVAANIAVLACDAALYSQ